MNLIKFKNEQFPSIFEDEFFKPFNSMTRTNNNLPKVNVFENEKEYNIDVAIPGIPKNDLKVMVKNNLLTIEKEEKKEKNKKEENYNFKEFSYSSFKRSFSLPENIDIEKIESKHENGILNIIIPKVSEEKLCKIIKIE